MVIRREFLTGATLLAAAVRILPDESDPWTQDELLQPAELAQMLRTDRNVPVILCVGFPVLYRQKHITPSILAGPASKPEGIAGLKQAVSKLASNADLVIYCGCCPMIHCPNIRPAYRTLRDLGLRNIRVLNLPQNLHTDWTQKGYPAG